MDNIRTKQGFTLIEVLAAVFIIAIMAVITFVYMQEVRTSARNATRVANVNQINLAIELYINDQNEPPGIDDIEYINGDPNWIPGLVPKYMSIVPSDPIDEGEFKYHYVRKGVNFEVAAFMEDRGNDPSCGDGGGGGCDYYEKGPKFLTIYNPGASGWNFIAEPEPEPEPEPELDTDMVCASYWRFGPEDPTFPTFFQGVWTDDPVHTDSIVSCFEWMNGGAFNDDCRDTGANNVQFILIPRSRLTDEYPENILDFSAEHVAGRFCPEEVPDEVSDDPLVCASYFQADPGGYLYPRTIQGTWNDTLPSVGSQAACLDYMQNAIFDKPDCAQPADVDTLTILLISNSKHTFDIPSYDSSEYVTTHSCP